MSNRIEKVNSLLKHEISQIIQREIVFPEGVLATLTHVETTTNLIEAKLFISVFPEEKKEQVINVLQKDVYSIQQQVNKKLNMRPVPKIKFVLDKNIAHAGRVEELLAQLKNNEK